MALGLLDLLDPEEAKRDAERRRQVGLGLLDMMGPPSYQGRPTQFSEEWPPRGMLGKIGQAVSTSFGEAYDRLRPVAADFAGNMRMAFDPTQPGFTHRGVPGLIRGVAESLQRDPIPTVADFTPGLGDAKALAYDAPNAFREGRPLVGGIAAASALPVLGLPFDAARQVMKRVDDLPEAGAMPRLPRADELGYTVDAYHSSATKFDDIRPSGSNTGSPDAEIATWYWGKPGKDMDDWAWWAGADEEGITSTGAQVYPMRINPGKSLRLGLDDPRPPGVPDDVWEAFVMNESHYPLIQWAREEGFDTIHFPDGTTSDPGDVWAVLKGRESSVRSRFDPDFVG